MTPRIYQLRISLDEIQPAIWRRIQVPGFITLLDLHFIIQLAMGWTNSHLHEYFIDGKHYGDFDDDELDWRKTWQEKDYKVEDVMPPEGDQFLYLYDFGDGWKHTVKVEKIGSSEEVDASPRCFGGERSCPPEDVGGTYGYLNFLDVIGNQDHPEHENYLLWVGGHFDSESFNLDLVNEVLNNYKQSEMLRIYRRYCSSEAGPELFLYPSVNSWVEDLTENERNHYKSLPLRRDTVTLLKYLRDHKVTGTTSQGNLPLKAIRDVTAAFVNPPIIEKEIGDRIYEIRSEFEVWPVYFIHTLLEIGGLRDGGPGRRLRLSSRGEQFLDVEPALQVWFLLETWWFHTNWLIAYPPVGIGDYLPINFQIDILYLLLAMTADQFVPFDGFADQVIETTRLKWNAKEMSFARQMLHYAVERMVINVLVSFGILNCRYKEKWIGNYQTSELDTFLVTEAGKRLLMTLTGGLI